MRVKTGQPALAGAMIVDGKLKAAAAVGTRKKGTENWVSLNDRFIIGSCGKAFTAALGAIMVEEGFVDWETTIKEIFPLVSMRPEYENLNFEQLLSHRAGLVKSFTADLDKNKTYTWTQGRMEYLKQLSQQKLLHPPGTALFYSNAGYILAGLIMERVSGKAFMTLMSDKIFKPLNIRTAGYGPPAKSAPLSQPWGHVWDRSGRSLKATLKENQLYTTPAGNVCISVTDWARFIIANMWSGGHDAKSFLSSGIKRKLYTPTDNLPWRYDQEYFEFWKKEIGWPLNTSNYALGWFVTRSQDGRSGLHHAGTSTAFQAEVYLSPINKNAILLVTNSRLRHIHLYKTAKKIKYIYGLDIDLP